MTRLALLAVVGSAACCLLATAVPGAVRGDTSPETGLHYAANRNIAPDGTYRPGRLGFDLADVDTPAQMALLPSGVRALVYLGMCDGVTPSFEATVSSFSGSSRLFGFYLADTPDPARCPAAALRAESDYIHAQLGGVRTFILEQNLASSQRPRFGYGPGNTGIDLYGIDPYPCRSELGGCDYAMIDRYGAAATEAGIPETAVVPVYQAFGWGRWVDDGGGSYLLPTAAQETEIIRRWHSLAPDPEFDYVYSWGRQHGDVALKSAPRALKAVFAEHNR